MRRRQFIEMAANVAGASVLAGCMSRAKHGIRSPALADARPPTDAATFRATRRMVKHGSEQSRRSSGVIPSPLPAQRFPVPGTLERLAIASHRIFAEST
jgi:hypothetical protein